MSENLETCPNCQAVLTSNEDTRSEEAKPFIKQCSVCGWSEFTTDWDVRKHEGVEAEAPMQGAAEENPTLRAWGFIFFVLLLGVSIALLHLVSGNNPQQVMRFIKEDIEPGTLPPEGVYIRDTTIQQTEAGQGFATYKIGGMVFNESGVNINSLILEAALFDSVGSIVSRSRHHITAIKHETSHSFDFSISANFSDDQSIPESYTVRIYSALTSEEW